MKILGRLASRRKLGQHHRHQHECRSGLNAGKGRLSSSSVARRGLEHSNCMLLLPGERVCSSGKRQECRTAGYWTLPISSAGRPRSALLQELDSSDVFGSPTWARTRDLRINSRPLDLPANRHECCVFRVVVSNIPCLLRPSRTRGRPSLKHWILEAKPIARREGRVGRPRGRRDHRDGPGATARCLLAGSTTRPADLGKRPRAAFRYLRLLTRKPP